MQSTAVYRPALDYYSFATSEKSKNTFKSVDRSHNQELSVAQFPLWLGALGLLSLWSFRVCSLSVCVGFKIVQCPLISYKTYL